MEDVSTNRSHAIKSNTAVAELRNICAGSGNATLNAYLTVTFETLVSRENSLCLKEDVLEKIELRDSES